MKGTPGAVAIHGVVFDLDGTLVDSRRDIAEAANYALDHAGLPRLPHAELASYVGDGAPALMARAARLDILDHRTSALVESFLAYYEEHPLDHTLPMPGAFEALDALRSYALGVCTNKPRRTTLPVLSGLGLAVRFSAVVAGDDLAERKPHPAMVQEAARLLGVVPGAVVMVGDGPQDVLAGKAAGARTIGVRGGMQAVQRLEQAAPDLLIDTLSELPAALNQLVSGTRR